MFALDICGYAVSSSDICTYHSNYFLCFVAILKCMSIGNLKNFRWVSEQKGTTVSCVASVFFQSVITFRVLGLLKDGKVISFWK